MNEDHLYQYGGPSRSNSRIVVDPSRRGHPVDDRLFGKFCEHLGHNIYGGMYAQVLLNPTFGPWEFSGGDDHPDGGIQPIREADALRQAIHEYADRWHLTVPDDLFDAYRNGAAFGWLPTDPTVRTPPDVSPEGDRAQRIVLDDGGGLYQWTYLPLHRTRTFELDCRLRATEPTTVTVAVRDPDAASEEEGELAAATFEVGQEWATYEAELDVDSTSRADDATYTVALTGGGSLDLVVDRMTLYPDDHVGGADPEVIAYLRDADLPLLRWPGGNFASGYRWRDGVGPLHERRSTVNPAWGRGESNLFGTGEFVAFCDAVGCEPVICVNAGDGSPAEAARWIEYCNGSPDTEMGALRAAHGSPEPFDVRYWEVGNELFGRWQVGWTTPSGNADRYCRFRDAMRDADSTIELLACGNRNSPNDRWNGHLIDAAAPDLGTITDHVLTGGPVDAGTDPDELFHGFMGYAAQLGREYRSLRRRMRDAGVERPRLAITELQLFADFVRNREIEHHGRGLSPETMPTRTTVSEPLYDATIIHECIRMGEFVQMVTHSATVNHGGGLRKKRERTWLDPAHYGHVLLSALAGGTPLGVDVFCDAIETSESFGDIDAFDGIPAIDVMAVEHEDELVVTIVNRRSDDRGTDASLNLSRVAGDGPATVTTLAADEMSAENTYDEPDRVTPESTTISVTDDELVVPVPAYSLVRVTVPR